jgi:hypothetical protein
VALRVARHPLYRSLAMCHIFPFCFSKVLMLVKFHVSCLQLKSNQMFNIINIRHEYGKNSTQHTSISSAICSLTSSFISFQLFTPISGAHFLVNSTISSTKFLGAFLNSLIDYCFSFDCTTTFFLSLIGANSLQKKRQQ